MGGPDLLAMIAKVRADLAAGEIASALETVTTIEETISRHRSEVMPIEPETLERVLVELGELTRAVDAALPVLVREIRALREAGRLIGDARGSGPAEPDPSDG